MYCIKCGNKIKDESKYCTKCGSSLDIDKVEKQKADGKAVASLIFGFVTLFLSFTLSILIFPFALLGLILGIVSKTKCSEKTAGIVINIISMVISVVVFIILIILIIIIGITSEKDEETTPSIVTDNSNYTWNCKLEGDDNYSITLSLNGDAGSYIWSKYDDTINNAVYGSYESQKINENEYTIKFISSSIISNGTLQEYEYVSNYELYFYNGDNFQMNSLDNSSRYYCDIED